jgi:hypothetical protein
VSKEVLSFDMRFDKNNNELIVLDSDWTIDKFPYKCKYQSI